jgi:hypothetical protein
VKIFKNMLTEKRKNANHEQMADLDLHLVA